jgi:hypothetical protein
MERGVGQKALSRKWETRKWVMRVVQWGWVGIVGIAGREDQILAAAAAHSSPVGLRSCKYGQCIGWAVPNNLAPSSLFNGSLCSAFQSV